MKNIAILGSTGSIGTQALEVVANAPERFKVTVLTAGSQAALLAEQARKFRPQAVVIADENKYTWLKDTLADLPVEVLAGEAALAEVVARPEIDIVLTALVGFAGLRPTLAAIAAGKDIALANKETLVVAGALVTRAAAEKGVKIIPVDSEHSAIFQCLQGEAPESVEKLILTASGGPFRGYSQEQIAGVTREQALRHPNWAMGAKITVDSASMMNKGLEVIEAHWLFGTPLERIQVLVHPQSIIHSMVQFTDGSLKAQLGLPDMRLPIQYALGYPERGTNPFPRTDFLALRQLTFEDVDRSVFRSLNLAWHALERGGNLPCILNAANEEAVALFLRGSITFADIFSLLEKAVSSLEFLATPDLGQLFETDRHTRRTVASLARAVA